MLSLRKEKVDYKVFETRDLEKLISFFMHKRDELAGERCYFQISIDFEDGTTNQGDDLSVLDDTRLIESFSMSLKSYDLNKEMRISIAGTCRYEVGSEDKDWNAANFEQIKEILRVVKPQNRFLASFVGRATISTLVGNLIAFVLSFSIASKVDIQNYKEYVVVGFIVLFLIILLVQFIFSSVLDRLLFKWYPAIEFDTTLEHINKNKKAKAVWTSVLTVVIVPVVIGFLFWFA